jgi:hypothetical protein
MTLDEVASHVGMIERLAEGPERGPQQDNVLEEELARDGPDRRFRPFRRSLTVGRAAIRCSRF